MSAPGRVFGWDLLRGLCALAVMTYHLMMWQSLAHVSTLGTYTVYLFFTLSGASLAYVYDRQALSGAGVARFLALRWLRLAPLYLLVSVLWLAMLAWHQGAWADRILQRLLINATFTFGLSYPTLTALPVGGWSLGIEAVFYVALPLIVRLLPRLALRWGLLLAVAALQAWWIDWTVGGFGLAASIVYYQQVPGFAAYFVAGCLIGRWQRGRLADLPAWAGAGLWGALAALLLATSPSVPGGELVGWRGLLLPPACMLAVWLSGRVRLQGSATRWAARLGDLTYGAYLLHPVVFFGLVWFVLPRLGVPAVEELPALARVALVLGCGLVTCLGALASERWLERPVRQAARKLFDRLSARRTAGLAA